MANEIQWFSEQPENWLQIARDYLRCSTMKDIKPDMQALYFHDALIYLSWYWKDVVPKFK